MSIEFRDVSYTYMEGTSFSHAAISNINFTINEGEFVAIIGHTGSGKSTLISHMNGILQPTHGNCLVDGVDLSVKKTRKAVRAKLGMVFQYPEYQLFEETVAKDIAFGVKNMGLDDAQTDERVREAMSYVGLDYDKFADKSPFELSGGEKRRAALAGIIAMRPKYLVLDEPMAGLDPMGRHNILDVIVKLQQALGCAVIMISHSMDDVARFATRIIMLNDGKILMDDTTEAVFSQPQTLLSCGLGLPQAVVLAEALRARGMDIPMSAYRPDQLYCEISRRLELC